MRKLRFLASVTLVLAAAVPAIVVACGGGSSNSLGGTSSHDAGEDAEASIYVPSEDAPSEYIPDANFDAVLPLNMVDGSDRPEGGALVTPGVILCGGGTCNAFAGNQCCTGDEEGTCLSSAVPCPTGGGSMLCNESADCVQGDVCCGSLDSHDAGIFDAGDGGVFRIDAGPLFVSSLCTTSCNTTLIQLCRTNSECEDSGPCVIQSCPDGHTYELCGVFSLPVVSDGGPSFACTPL
jgi:hypothetical protein